MMCERAFCEGAAMEINACGITDTGRMRRNNQDAIYVSDSKMLFIVSDGMGGHAGGEVASRMVVNYFDELPHRDLPVGKGDRLVQMFFEKEINEASAKIYLRSLENSELREMGTTCSLVWIHGGKAHCAHAGDSRIYLWRHGFLYRLTEDHSLVAEQLKAGLISEESAENHALRNVITRSVGYRKDEHIDTFSHDLMSGDRLLLCSDGLHNEVSDHKISEVLSSYRGAQDEHLVNLANEAGGRDNISVVIVCVL